MNVGTGEDLTIRSIAEVIQSVVGYEGLLTFDPAFPDGTPRKVLDVSRASSLGWTANVPKRGVNRDLCLVLRQL